MTLLGTPDAVEVSPSQGPAPSQGTAGAPRHWLLPGWPLVVIFAGMPLWWVLGTVQLIFVAMSVPMLVCLARLRRVDAPPGLGIWLLFIVWLLGGLFTMQVTAPGTISGASQGRYVVFAYRGMWYVIGTIALLYVVNTRHFLSTQRITRALGWMFVVLVGGGLLGVTVPTLEFPSVLELLLPRALSNNGFVSSLVHPQVAQIQDFLGYVEPRPSAPFAFSNEWGLNIAVTMPFFVASWWTRGGSYKLLVPIVLGLSMIPIVSSLNRGLWLALTVSLFYLALRWALAGRLSVVVAFTVAVAIAAVVIAASPLGSLMLDRLNTPHSNEGRASLSSLSVQSALEGSPVIGFGTTRDVSGNFNSIAGGATDECPRCSPPPLGTQGQLWLVLFGAGLGGLALYVSFFAAQFLRYVRSTSAYSLAAQCSLVMLLVTMPVYNAVGAAIFISLIAVGVLVREGGTPGERQFVDLIDPARRNVALILALALLGGAGGLLVQRTQGSLAAATQSVVVPAGDVFGVPGTRGLSLDSEAQLVLAEPVLGDVVAAANQDSVASLADGISITARPNSRILNIVYEAADPEMASVVAVQIADSYLTYRESLADEAELARAERLQEQQAALAGPAALVARTTAEAGDLVNPQLLETAVRLRLATRSSFGELSSLQGGGASAGQKLGEVRVREPMDSWLIRVGSGAMLGLFAGLVAAWYADGRWNRVGRHPQNSLGLDIPTVARVRRRSGADLADGGSVDTLGAVRTYLPLSGIVVDVHAAGARAVGKSLKAGLEGPMDHMGKRVLLVVSSRSRPHTVRRMHRTCLVSGQQPVGLILAEE